MHNTTSVPFTPMMTSHNLNPLELQYWCIVVASESLLQNLYNISRNDHRLESLLHNYSDYYYIPVVYWLWLTLSSNCIDNYTNTKRYSFQNTLIMKTWTTITQRRSHGTLIWISTNTWIMQYCKIYAQKLQYIFQI